MSKGDPLYLGHMLDSAEGAVAKLSGKSRIDFDSDENLRLALAHLLQTIGEAARRVSPRFRERHRDVPWSAMIGMRHKVVHDYLNVDYDVVWKTVVEDLPPLVENLRRIVGSGKQD